MEPSSRGRGLGTLGKIISGRGQALIGQAQSLADDVQRRIADVVPPVLSGRLDGLADRLRDVEAVLSDGGKELTDPVRGLAMNAIDSAARLRARLEDLCERLDAMERRLSDLEQRSR